MAPAGGDVTDLVKCAPANVEESEVRCRAMTNRSRASGSLPDRSRRARKDTGIQGRAMKEIFRIGLVAGIVALAGCSNATTIKSDLVLQPNSRARIQLHQRTQAIELLNDSDTDIHVTVLDNRDRTVSDMMLSAHDQVRLDLLPARAIQFENKGTHRGVLRWTLRNDNKIEYTLAMSPG